jgi:hypothetical protein
VVGMASDRREGICGRAVEVNAGTGISEGTGLTGCPQDAKIIPPEFHVNIKLPSFTCNWRRILGKYSVLYHFRHHLDMNFTNIFFETEFLVW